MLLTVIVMLCNGNITWTKVRFEAIVMYVLSISLNWNVYINNTSFEFPQSTVHLHCFSDPSAILTENASLAVGSICIISTDFGL